MLPCRLAAFAMILLFAGCSAAREESRIAALVPLDATVTSFDVCHGTSCKVRTPVGLSDEQWEQIAEIFDRSAKSAAVERRNIAHAIALFERFVGQKTGTMHDVGGNLAVPDQAGQLDCIDESVNTTTYLRLLKDADLLQWHDVAFPAHRNPNLIDFHNTAVIIERDNRMYWAVDSWFRPNAHDPYIVPLSAWHGGWRPGDGAVAVSVTPSTTAVPDDTNN
ncbi:MAG: hypothetical protein WD044_00875 [Dongiaceae bacterium]